MDSGPYIQVCHPACVICGLLVLKEWIDTDLTSVFKCGVAYKLESFIYFNHGFGLGQGSLIYKGLHDGVSKGMALKMQAHRATKGFCGLYLGVPPGVYYQVQKWDGLI